jgi:diguanylate cyclase (GGDEF)-like protein
LVHTAAEGASGVAEKVRASVESMGRRVGYPEGLVTASVGVAAFVPGRGPATEDVLVAADRALYRAKAAGRNQIATGEQVT